VIVAVTSDVHLGHPQALVEEFFKAAATVGPKVDIFVLAGDIIDNPQPKAIKLFEQFLEIAKENDFFEKLFFVYGGMRHEVKVLHSYPRLLMDDYCLLSTTFGRVVIIHGNNINLYYKKDQGESAKVGAERAKRNLIRHPVDWLPGITQDDYLVLGHLHQRFYYEPARIYCLGCWLPTKNMRNNTGYILVINDQVKDSFTAINYSELEII
jgi:predicted phosphodiesterase